MTSAGEILAARWRLDEKIDAGAMGEIFRGHHCVLGHTVAIKVMIPDAARDASATERFLREARIAARLRHPHVVRVEDFGVSDKGRSFLVMELLCGESLARRLARPPRLAAAEVLEILRQLGEALDVAHREGIVHRDLKPENIFLCESAPGSVHVKVLDFGVAKFADALSEGGHATASNALIGTPKYMSPEQARSSRDLDGRSDLWAVGMLVYEMLTGRHPFEGEAIAELLVAILTHRIPAPTSAAPALPPSVDVWMARALARNRVERFATGRAMHEALAEALDGRIGESWADPWEPPPTARRATLRVHRGGAVEAGAGPRVRERETTPDQLPAFEATPALVDDARKPSRESRTSWRSGAALGLVAAAAILGLARWRMTTTRLTPPAPPVGAASMAIAVPPPETPSRTPPAPGAPLAEFAAPDAAVTGATAVESTPPNPRRSRRRHARTVPNATTAGPVTTGAMYDPSGI